MWQMNELLRAFVQKVLNRSSRALGSVSHSKRHVETRVTFPEESGALFQSPPVVWGNEVIREVTDLAAQESSHIPQKVRIASQAESYCRVAIQVDLYISLPVHEPSKHEHTEIQM